MWICFSSVEMQVEAGVKDDPRDLWYVGADGLLYALPIPVRQQFAFPQFVVGFLFIDTTSFILRIEGGDEPDAWFIVTEQYFRFNEGDTEQFGGPPSDWCFECGAPLHRGVLFLGLWSLVSEEFDGEISLADVWVGVVDRCGD